MTEVVSFPTLAHVFMTLIPLLFAASGIFLMRKYRFNLNSKFGKKLFLGMLGFSLFLTGLIFFFIVLTVWVEWLINGEVTIGISRVAGLSK